LFGAFFIVTCSIGTIKLLLRRTLLLSVRYSAFLPLIFEIPYLSIIKIFPLKIFFMKQLLTVLVIFSITSLFIACNSNTAESGTNTATEKEMKSFDLAEAKAAIDATNAAFGTLVGKTDSAGLAALYTSDAKFMVPNMPAFSGRANIQSAFSGMFAETGPIDLKLTSNEVSGNEEMVNEVGSYSMTDKKGKEIDKGKYIVLWKMEDGKWKLHRDIFNSDMPPMPMAPAKK